VSEGDKDCPIATVSDTRPKNVHKGTQDNQKEVRKGGKNLHILAHWRQVHELIKKTSRKKPEGAGWSGKLTVPRGAHVRLSSRYYE